MQDRKLETKRFGFGPYDGVSANGWHVMDGDESVAGPFVDAGVAFKRLKEIEKGTQ